MKPARGVGDPEAEPTALQMRLKVGIMGGATGVMSKDVLARAHRLGGPDIVPRALVWSLRPTGGSSAIG